MILPRATKTSLVKLLQDKGYDIPSIYRVTFSSCRRAYFVRWVDSNDAYHMAYYSTVAGKPILQVDKAWIDLTMAEVIQYGLFEQKNAPADAGTSTRAAQ